MATCTKCGAELAENEKFCGVCGTPVPAAAPAKETVPAKEEAPVKEEAPAKKEAPAKEVAPAKEAAPAKEEAPAKEAAPIPAAAPASNPASAQTATPYNYKNNFTETASEIKQSMREFAGSGVFLLYIILSAAAIVLKCIGHDTGSIIGTLIIYIPAILVIIGMLMGYADAKSADGPVGKGIGLYKAGYIIHIVVTVIIFVLLILSLVFGAFMASGNPQIFEVFYSNLPSEVGILMTGVQSGFDGSSTAVTITAIVFIVLLVIGLILLILYYRSLIKAATSIRRSLARGKRSGHVSAYPIVILVIIAIFSILGCLFTAASIPGIAAQLDEILRSLNIDPAIANVATTSALLPIIETVINVISVILAIILLTQLRKRINKI